MTADNDDMIWMDDERRAISFGGMAPAADAGFMAGIAASFAGNSSGPATAPAMAM
jgi:hypothetical protein